MNISGSNIEIDFHHLTVEDSLRIVEAIINKARIADRMFYCSFITGHGKIKDALLDLLINTYCLEPYIPFTNTGVIRVTIE